MNIRLFNKNDFDNWNQYVFRHPESTNCHLPNWQAIFESVYRIKSHYIVAEDNKRIVGILPLFQIKSILFGNQLVSMPYLSCGGILADNDKILEMIISEAEKISEQFKVDRLELRQQNKVSGNLKFKNKWHENANKVRMILELPPSSDLLFNSFSAKLRSQIRRPQKEDMYFKMGGSELVNDFYEVFSRNMRDLGSPVHKKKLFFHICKEFKKCVKIGVVYSNSKPVASGLIIIFKNRVEIPWASSLRKFNKFSPNMLLYWSFLEYACQNGLQYFDFGRSSPMAGTYKFKAQWGCKDKPLFWYEWSSYNRSHSIIAESGSGRIFQNIWAHIPVPIANYIGPQIRGYIPL
jgi:serine/alanine adding enzyme